LPFFLSTFLVLRLFRFSQNSTMPDWRGESGHILMQLAKTVNFIPVLEDFFGTSDAARRTRETLPGFQPCPGHPFLQ